MPGAPGRGGGGSGPWRAPRQAGGHGRREGGGGDAGAGTARGRGRAPLGVPAGPGAARGCHPGRVPPCRRPRCRSRPGAGTPRPPGQEEESSSPAPLPSPGKPSSPLELPFLAAWFWGALSTRFPPCVSPASPHGARQQEGGRAVTRPLIPLADAGRLLPAPYFPRKI